VMACRWGSNGEMLVGRDEKVEGESLNTVGFRPKTVDSIGLITTSEKVLTSFLPPFVSPFAFRSVNGVTTGPYLPQIPQTVKFPIIDTYVPSLLCQTYAGSTSPWTRFRIIDAAVQASSRAPPSLARSLHHFRLILNSSCVICWINHPFTNHGLGEGRKLTRTVPLDILRVCWIHKRPTSAFCGVCLRNAPPLENEADRPLVLCVKNDERPSGVE